MVNLNPNLEVSESQNGNLFRWFTENPDKHITWLGIYDLIGTNKAATRVSEIIDRTGLPINRDTFVEIINRNGKLVRVRDYFLPRCEYEKWKEARQHNNTNTTQV